MTVTQLREGDYRPDGAGGFALATGGAGVLERVLFLLTARRGGFPLLPEVGSRLYLLSRARPSARGALGASYAAEALAGEENLRVLGAVWTEETRTLTVEREWQGEPRQAVLNAAALGWQDRQEDTGEMAVRMYSLAAQIYGLYEELAWTCRQCFPQTATGEELEKHGFLRGIARNPARQASGTLRFSVQEAVEEDLEIAQGTVCMTAGLVAFETTQAGVLPAGELSVDLPAQAVEPGPGGNVSAGTVRTMAVAPVGVAACTNPLPFTGGREEEGDEELRARILATYQQLPNGTNGAYYAQEALAVEGVTAVRVLPKNRGMGTVDVIIAGVEGLPGEELLRQVQERLEQKREIAVDVAVLAPEPVAVRLILSVKPKPGLLPGPVIARVQEAMETWFDGSMLGRDLLLAQIGQRIYQVEGVDNYRIEGPANDVVVAENQLPVLESVSVEELR